MIKNYKSLLSVLELTCLLLSLALQSGCSNQPAEATAPLVIVELTQIVDKTSRQPITENTITLRWETSDG
jgi:hypothetical protein